MIKRFIIIYLFSCCSIFSQASVIDGANLMENIKQTLYQVTIKQTLLSQLEYQARNSLNCENFLFDSMDSIINNLINSINYNISSCLKSVLNASNDQFDKMKYLESESLANNSMINGIMKQQENLKIEADQLKNIQKNIQGVQGQMQAIQSANQLASAQINQLMQIRTLLIAQQQAEASKNYKQNAEESAKEQFTKKYTEGTYQGGGWKNLEL